MQDFDQNVVFAVRTEGREGREGVGCGGGSAGGVAKVVIGPEEGTYADDGTRGVTRELQEGLQEVIEGANEKVSRK